MNREIHSAELSILRKIQHDRLELIAGIDADIVPSADVRSVLVASQSVFREKSSGTLFDIVGTLPGGAKTFNAILARVEGQARVETGSDPLDDPSIPLSRAIDLLKAERFRRRRGEIIARIAAAHRADDIEGVSKAVEELCLSREETDRKYTALISDGVPEALGSFCRFSACDHSGRIPFGIRGIDNALRGGMQAGAIYLLGAPSGHGKTTLLQSIAVGAARIGGVLFVSPEMSKEELAEREIIRRSGKPLFSRAPWIHPADRLEAENAHTQAAVAIQRERLAVHVLEDLEASMAQISIEAAKIKNLCLVILDYAQEIADIDAKTARYLAVGEVGEDAIAMGRKFKIPVLIASQVNVSKNKNGAGVDYSFRESQKLEHKAHVSMIMEVKRSKTEDRNGFYPVEETRIFAKKNRSGPLFSVKVDYRPELFRITDILEQVSDHRTGDDECSRQRNYQY